MNGQVEIREASSGKLILRGFASVSETWYPVGGMFEELVKRGTWKRSIAQQPDVVLLQDHSGLGFARTKTPSGDPTLLLSETDRGLFCEAFLDATSPRVQDLRSTSENAGLQMSVAFRCSSDSWNEDRTRREIKEASLNRGDVTCCNFGCNEAAEATISERGEAGAKERRAYADSLKGATERRMCPVEGFELRETPRGHATIAVRAPLMRSYVEEAKAIRAKLRAGPGAVKAKPAPTGRYSVERARAARAKARRAHPGSGSSVEGEDDRAYTEAEVQALGERNPPAALAKANGKGFHYPIVDARDVSAAVEAYGRAKPSERVGVRAWIVRRARELRAEHRLPAGWGVIVQKLHPSEQPDSGATESVTGQQQ